jgi:hypothetical protein
MHNSNTHRESHQVVTGTAVDQESHERFIYNLFHRQNSSSSSAAIHQGKFTKNTRTGRTATAVQPAQIAT